MLKKFTSLSLIYAIFLLSSFSTQIFAQTQPNALKADTSNADISKTEVISLKTDVKKVFSKDLQKSKSITEVSEIDFKKMEKADMKGAAKAKLSHSQRNWLVVFFVALAVGVTLLAIYGKVPKCSDVSCNPDFDENCICDN
ncbi:MAG: hypothetical protein WA584_10690 [Pyrinomonadaceae bacterium]